MTLSLRHLIILATALLLVPMAQADDVCEARPDLCGGPARTKKKKVKRKSIEQLERELIAEERNTAKPKKVKSDSLDFDAYLSSNAKNPALSGRAPSSQTAFQPAKPRGAPLPDPVTTGGPVSSPGPVAPTPQESAAPPADSSSNSGSPTN